MLNMYFTGLKKRKKNRKESTIYDKDSNDIALIKRGKKARYMIQTVTILR